MVSGEAARIRRRAGVACAVWAIAFSLLAVVAALPSPPSAVLTADDATPFVGEPVTFDASRSAGHDEGRGRIVAYRFDFGDGSGTDWQASPGATHAYDHPGRWTASVVVRDGRNLEGRASLRIDVRDVPPPTGDAPDLEPLAASANPARPHVDDVVVLAVTVMNRGGTPADAAAVRIADRRPGGNVIALGEIPLGEPLAPGASRVLFSGPFLAVEEGTHEIEILVADVEPEESRTDNNRFVAILEVLPPKPNGNGNGNGGTPLAGPDVLVVALAFAAIGAFGVGAALMNRPREPRPREPPGPEPRSREPPPPWPP